MLSKLNPTPVKTPELVLFNEKLSKEIDLDFSQIDNKELALIFSGNQLPDGSVNSPSLWRPSVWTLYNFRDGRLS